MATDTTNSIVVIDPTALSTVATIPISTGPLTLAMSPDGTRLYATHHNDGSITAINPASNSVVTTIATPGADAMAFSPDASLGYVVNTSGITVIDVPTSTLIRQISLPSRGLSIALTGDGLHAYVSCRDGNAYFVDLSAGAVLATIAVGGYSFHQGVAITPDGKRAYLLDFNAGVTSVIDTASNTIISRISTGVQPLGVAITPDGTKAYVAASYGPVYVIDVATNTVIAKIAVNNHPANLAITGDGSSVYVTDQLQGVDQIDVGSNTVIAEIPTGGRPNGVALSPAPPGPTCSNTPSIFSVQTNQGGNGGLVTVNVTGCAFQAGATLKLSANGQADVVAPFAITLNPNGLAAVFDLTTAAAGTWNVTVKNPDNSAATLANGFQVLPGGAPTLSAYLVGPSEFRVGNLATYNFVVQNIGLIDDPQVTVQVNSSLPNCGLAPTIVDIPPGVPRTFPFTCTSSTAICFNLMGSTSEGGSSPDCADEKKDVAAAQAQVNQLMTQIARLRAQLISQVSEYNMKCQGINQLLPSCIVLGLQIQQTKDQIFATQLALQAAEEELALAEAALKKCLDGLSPQQRLSTVDTGLGVCAVSSLDPNGKTGTSGVGAAQYVRGAVPLSYVVQFENLPTASAPAQEVRITDPLDPSLSTSNVFLQSIRFGNTDLELPPGTQMYGNVVDLRPSQNLLVNVSAMVANGLVSVDLISIDPNTGLPPTDPSVGFLPPDKNPPQGEGNVTFIASPKPSLPTGTQIQNTATIIFDSNPAMKTHTWLNTLDNTPPTSQVSGLPGGESCPNFKVAWSGNDVGAGLANFTTYVSDNGGPFASWLTNTTLASSVYQGQIGHSYGFYSIATDLVGNVEPGKSAAEATTQVTANNSCGPPSLSGTARVNSYSQGVMSLNVQLNNIGTADALNVTINQLTFRTLSGSGNVTLSSPKLPITVGNIPVDNSSPVTLTLNVPATVKKFSITESGTMQDTAGKKYNYSIGQSVVTGN